MIPNHRDVTVELYKSAVRCKDNGRATRSHLLNAQVVIDGGVARRAGEVLVLAVHDVHVRFGIAVPLGQAKVNDVHDVAPTACIECLIMKTFA